MKNIKSSILALALIGATVCTHPVFSQEIKEVRVDPLSPEGKQRANAEQEKRAAEWVASLNLNDAAKESRLRKTITTHLITIRDWNNEHQFSTVPAGINPVTGTKLSDLDRQIIANSAMPKTIHEDLMAGLRKELSEDQVELILDKYTIGKVAFTMKAYKEIVPNMTAEEEAVLIKNLKQAREQAIDYKNMTQVSAIFEIYKTKNEQYLNSNGRSWRQMYNDYTKILKAKKAAEAAAKK